MQKSFRYTVYGFLGLIGFFTASCYEGYNHPLGNNLSLWEGDTKEDRIVVYCEGNCQGGIYVVPTYERHFDSSKQHYAEFVEEATSNEKWVIVKSLRIKEKQNNYWIISKNFTLKNIDCSKANCDSILQSHVMGPMNSEAFGNRLRELNIDLDFK
jgi:hypothetical protein